MTETTTYRRGDTPKPRKIGVRQNCSRCAGQQDQGR